jgi:hypothetical protein
VLRCPLYFAIEGKAEREELPIDLLEFFCLTPLPGSEDHQTLWKNGVAMDPDLNRYDVEHVCTAVCTDNLNAGVAVMKSAQDGA